MDIYLIRHGQSKANTGEHISNHNVPDNKIELTDLGKEQCFSLGANLKQTNILTDSLIFHSPFTRTRQSLAYILSGANLNNGWDYNVNPEFIYDYSEEDPRLREIDIGSDGFHDKIRERKEYGYFYYRFNGGEAQCEVFDRICSFYNEAYLRCVAKNRNMVIVSHGLTIRTLIMRIMRLNEIEFGKIVNPKNASLIKISSIGNIKNPIISKSEMSIEGIEMRK